MELAAGARVGPYEIASLLGAGGMGEVYRARDHRLGREVALKVLPSSVASDADRLRRFEIEARAVAALNHPNILAVFDIGNDDGRSYLASELLEGESLRTRLAGTALPMRKALDYAIQIAHGLAAAHDKGIVHRDLKPENVFVTRDGRVKILDFGLAKLIPFEGSPVSSQDLTRSQSERGHDARDPDGHGGLHVSRAGAPAARGLPLRHLLLRGDPLRDALGAAGLPGRDADRHDARDPARGPARAVPRPEEHLSGRHARRPPLSREEPRRALPVGARSRFRPPGDHRDLRSVAAADPREVSALRPAFLPGRRTPARGCRRVPSRRPNDEQDAPPVLSANDVRFRVDLLGSLRGGRAHRGVFSGAAGAAPGIVRDRCGERPVPTRGAARRAAAGPLLDE